MCLFQTKPLLIVLLWAAALAASFAIERHSGVGHVRRFYTFASTPRSRLPHTVLPAPSPAMQSEGCNSQRRKYGWATTCWVRARCDSERDAYAAPMGGALMLHSLEVTVRGNLYAAVTVDNVSIWHEDLPAPLYSFGPLYLSAHDPRIHQADIDNPDNEFNQYEGLRHVLAEQRLIAATGNKLGVVQISLSECGPDNVAVDVSLNFTCGHAVRVVDAREAPHGDSAISAVFCHVFPILFTLILALVSFCRWRYPKKVAALREYYGFVDINPEDRITEPIWKESYFVTNTLDTTAEIDQSNDVELATVREASADNDDNDNEEYEEGDEEYV